MPKIPLDVQIQFGMIKVNRESPALYRFWASLSKNGPEAHSQLGKCWVWLKLEKHYKGYGVFRVGRCRIRAHRYAYELLTGDIPEGQHVLHKCDNPACVNPNHLFLGDHQINSQDKVNKGRQVKGEQFCTAKLTEAQVLEIRSRYKSRAGVKGEVNGLVNLAREYGVTKGSISKIVQGKSWKHLPSN